MGSTRQAPEEQKGSEMFKIIDNITNETVYAEDRDELQEKLESMFDTSEYGVEDAIETIANGIGHEYVGGEEAFLNVNVSIVDDTDED